MGRKTMAGMAAILALLALGMTLVAQEIGTPTQQEPMEYSRPDYQPGMQQQLTPAQQRAREEELLRMDAACMRRMGMDDTMINRRRMLMSMEVNPLDPHAVLSLRQELNLTQDQVKELQQIAQRTHDQVTQVLNDQQRQILSQLETTPQSMVAMCRQMQMDGMAGPMPGSSPMQDDPAGPGAPGQIGAPRTPGAGSPTDPATGPGTTS